MTRTVLAMVLLALVSACAAEVDEDYGGLAGPLTATPDEWLPAVGIQTGGTLQPQQLDTLAPNNVVTTRITFIFRPGVTVEPDGTVRAAHFDWQVAEHARRGISVLPVLIKTIEVDGPAPGDHGVRPVAKSELGMWEKFAATLAMRFGPGGTFWSDNADLPYMPIRAWEIWNEPNLAPFWAGPDGPRPSAVRYRRILRRAFIGLRTVDPRARVVFGGMAFPGNMDHSKNVDWREFMSKVLDGRNPPQRARNRCLVDAVSIHPYDESVGGAMDRVRDVYDFLERRNMTGKNRERRDAQIWITELGWAVPVPGHWPPPEGGGRLTIDSEEQQAARVRRVVEELAQRRGNLRIGPLYWYAYEDLDGVHDGKWPDWAGLWTRWPRHSDGSIAEPGRARPAWHALGHEAVMLDVLRLPPARCTLGDVLEQKEKSLRLLASDDADDDLEDEDGGPIGGSCPAASCTDDTGREICAGEHGVLTCPGGTQVCTCDADGGFSACSSCISY
jgi:hypothetical protein